MPQSGFVYPFRQRRCVQKLVQVRDLGATSFSIGYLALSRLNVFRVMAPVTWLVSNRAQIFKLLLDLLPAKRRVASSGLRMHDARGYSSQRCDQNGNVEDVHD